MGWLLYNETHTKQSVGLLPKYSISLYPGTGSANGIAGDHILLAPAYNCTEADIGVIVSLTVRVIEDFFAEFQSVIGASVSGV